MISGFKKFVQYRNSLFEFNWHHELQCELIDKWINNDIKHLMILAPPRSSKTELVSRMLPTYLDDMLSENKKVLHLTYSSSMSDELRRSYYKNCNYKLNNANNSIVRFSSVGYSLSSRFDYILMDDIGKPFDKNEKLLNWYNSDVLTRLGFEGKQLMIATHYTGDLPSKIIATNNLDWTVVKFPFVADKSSIYREFGKVLWDRMLPIGLTAKDIENKVGKLYYTTLYQQEDPKPCIEIY